MRRAGRAGSVVIAAVLGATAAAGCARTPDDPEQAFRAYLQAFDAHDCERIEAILAPDSPLGPCRGFEHEIDSSSIYGVDVVEETETAALIQANLEQASCRVELVGDDDAWSIHDVTCVGTRPDGAPYDLRPLTTTPSSRSPAG